MGNVSANVPPASHYMSGPSISSLKSLRSSEFYESKQRPAEGVLDKPELTRQDSLSTQHFEEVRQVEVICEESLPLPSVLQNLVLEYLHFDTFQWEKALKGTLIKLSKGSQVAKSISSSGTSWATVAGTRIWEVGRHYFEISIEALPENKIFPAQIACGFVSANQSADWVSNGYAVPGFTMPGWMFNLESGETYHFPSDNSTQGRPQTSQFFKPNSSVAPITPTVSSSPTKSSSKGSFSFRKLTSSFSSPATSPAASAVPVNPASSIPKSLVEIGTRIGICLDLDNGCIEYSVNGHALGIAFHGVKGQLRAVASMTRDGTQICLHFPCT